MRKFGIYFVIFTLIVSLCPVYPITAHAEEGEDSIIESKLSSLNETVELDAISNSIEYKEEKIILFSDEAGGAVDFFEDIPQQHERPVLTIPDETEAIQFVPELTDDNKQSQIEYALIEYTYVDDKNEEVTTLGYVHINHAIHHDHVETYKSERDISEKLDEAKKIEEENNKSIETDQSKANTDDNVQTNPNEENSSDEQVIDEKFTETEEDNEVEIHVEEDKEIKSKKKEDTQAIQQFSVQQTSTTSFKQGDRHSDVPEMKRNLNKIGFGGIKVTNLYGSFTAKRVKEFQQYFGLKATGVADQKTQNKIKAVANSKFQEGKRHNDTIQLKKDLNAIGFGKIKVTTLYGSYTVKKVKDLQREHNLVVNGIADDVTLAKIDELIQGMSIKQGDRHSDVPEMKRNLNKIGFGGIKVTNLYGSFTAKKVKEFQQYFGLKATGVADQKTQNKIKAVANSKFQEGKRHNDTIQLKKDLNAIGFGKIKVTTLYGSYTVKKVKDLQREHSLVVNGIADDVTLAKIEQLVKLENTKPVTKTEYTNYNLTLNQALDIQLNRPIITTDKYRNDPAYVSASYLRITSSAKVTGTRVNIRTEPNTTNNNNIALSLVGGTPITITDTTNGTAVSGSTLWYQISQNGQEYYIHSSLASTAQAEVINKVNVRAGKGTSHHVFGKLQKGDKISLVAQGPSWHQIEYTAWREPTRADLETYLDPSKNDKFQHLRLDSTVGVSASELNKALTDKGILEGQGQAFINGAKQHGVNEAYLMAHAFLETGHGTSRLANGVEYNGTTVYNMFGIGAVDSDPLNGGAKTAYENGWTTPAKAIEGGARWIGEGYIYNEYKQNTLYKMRWNPNMVNGAAWKQYASDIAWATKQVSQIKSIYEQLNNPSHHFDIARYK